MTKKVLIMAGGTGGHVFPGLALAKEMQDRNYVVEWLGTSAGIEARLVPEAGIPLHLIPVKGVRGKSLKQMVLAPMNIISSVWQALTIIKSIRPDVVVGLGGFVAGPGGLAAKLSGIPLLIHEQNAVAGTTNKILARIANTVLTAFPDTLKKSICIGNPVREDIEDMLPLEQRRQNRTDSKLHILVLGGSRGAQAINRMLPDALSRLENFDKLSVWHQTGDLKLDETQALYRSKLGLGDHDEIRIDAFIRDMAEAYRWADLVICRSGALTVSEIAAVGVGAVFIPFPYAIDDHQTANAKFLEKLGAAEIRQESELNGESLAEIIKHYVNDDSRLLNMANAARAFAKPKAARAFADYCEEVIHA
ncbi:UDP-N-acetylglucosamine--N-acetylmuramyl-(pentapeptide) pyrophosphoryl-undecaprenol N-acetylglucosamine transferase [Thalassocella blandensis]|nr:UDP-N-acetylglucosamine--N-acetylmuramyl-(pentapeptide) pyrophosphoryl-undecaprenol N-acetylglucosamine transferase [Thalassocella blandensis]